MLFGGFYGLVRCGFVGRSGRDAGVHGQYVVGCCRVCLPVGFECFGVGIIWYLCRGICGEFWFDELTFGDCIIVVFLDVDMLVGVAWVFGLIWVDCVCALRCYVGR